MSVPYPIRPEEMAVRCDECGALAGERCKSLRPQDRGRPIQGVHVKRSLLAQGEAAQPENAVTESEA